ncbi:uncharacterized protein LOC106867251 isoform X2 [Octopus bimaculoides]|uniref:uncharacterized protein LOC106867251 isoform X2 n=1 Tax=Octopus bimaculoides TaxID=37653 RepID=UPI0022E34875|nr:uncharacterized protein LOC106867251 isoform X2 [Octopus bimaculoides]
MVFGGRRTEVLLLLHYGRRYLNIMTFSCGDFRLEALDDTLNELQNEKKFLQTSLDQCKNKRLHLEQILESVNSKHTQISDLHRKLSVTLQVGYHKVAQTQSQILSLEDQIQKQRDNIKNTLKIFEEQKTNHLDNTKELEKQLSDIAQKLRNAKAFYTESNLSNETNLIRKKQKETEEKILTVKADVETKKDKQLQWQQYFEEFKSNFMEGFTESFKQIVWKIFELENEIYNEEYLALKEQFEILKDRTNLTD